MSDARKYATIFRAAANGYMAPYRSPPDFDGGTWGPFDSKAHDAARSMRGAFIAIADVFDKIADSEDAR